MASPSPTLRNPKRTSTTSPPRRPLQERSDSDTNERTSAAPTIRVVADSGPDVYSRSPFPTEPAHFLPPTQVIRYYSGTPISDENASAILATAKSSIDEGLYPPSLKRQSLPGNRISTGTNVSSDEDTLANFRHSISPSLSSRFSQATSSPSTPTLTGLSINDEEKLSLKLPALPENLGRESTSTIRLVEPSKSDALIPLRSNLSNTSLISSTSSGSIISANAHRSTTSLPSSPNFHVLANSSSPSASIANHTNLIAEPQSPIPKSKQSPSTAIVSSSTDSVAYSDASYLSVTPARHLRSASSPPSTSHASAQSETEDFVPDIRYPQLRQASANRSWATSSNSSGLIARMSEGVSRLSLWSDRLSTIPSESEPASEHASSALPSPRLRRERRSIASASEATGGFSSQSNSSVPIPAPLFSGIRPEPAILPQVRDSEEGEDTLGELSAPQVRPKRSGYLAKLKALSRPGSSESMRSQMSFQGDLSWVRTFYRSGQWPSQQSLYTSTEGSTSRLNTATSGLTGSPLSEAFPAEIHRPRNRARHIPINARFDRDIGANVNNSADVIEPVEEPSTENGVWTDRGKRPIWSSSNWGSGIFSPHLHRDRRGSLAINTWSTPSFDQPIGQFLFGPLNRQILLFCFGFIFPLGWFIAAFLPLPPVPASFDPQTAAERGVIQPGSGENVYVDMSPNDVLKLEYEERRFLKAQWWRQLNRIMCVAGLAIIGAIIALVVIATRLHPAP